MKFWQKRYDNRIYNVDYDSLVNNEEVEIKRLIARLGIQWEETCLAPEKNERVITTASSQQVRRRIYRDSSKAWRKFEPYLKGIFNKLEDLN